MQHGFRRDVQGLRALAVGLVAVGHARLGLFPGGFVGVDVFFVISGYLITGLLVTEAGGGTVSLLGFYARRARRILPAATVVIIATVLASLAVLDAIAARAVVKDALWSTFFAANVKFARDGTDYFNSGASVSPLQHYWSLAVEEQFYLVWPLLVLGLTLLARRGRATSPARRRARVRRLAVPLLVLVIIASLTWSVVATQQISAGSANAAYFSFFARAWELAIGALAACLAPRLSRLPAEMLGALSWLGLGGIVVAAIRYDDATPFPGSAALLPVVGAALLLVGGLRASRIGPQPLLSLRPVRAVGDWSYSFYLWHWPALILAGAVWGRPSGWYGALVLAVALGLSALTYHYVENPFRRARALSLTRLRGVLLYPAVVAMTIPLLAAADQVVVHRLPDGPPITQKYDPAAFNEDLVVGRVEASVQAARDDAEVPGTLSPSLLDLAEDRPDVGKCEYFNWPSVRELCPRGDVDGSRTLVLIGDSHARQWIPALDELGEKFGYTTYYLVREGCPGADVTPLQSKGRGPSTSCANFQDWAVRQLAELDPDVVLLASQGNPNGFETDDRRRVTSDDDVAEELRKGMERQILRVSAPGRRVIVVGDPPALERDPGECLSSDDSSLATCMWPPEPRSLLMINALRQAAKNQDVKFVETGSWFCADDECPAVIGGFIAHRDATHVSTPYAAYLSDELEGQLDLAGGVVMLGREVQDLLGSLGVHPDVGAVVEEVASRRSVTVDEPGDGSLLVRAAAGTAQVAATVHPGQLFLLVDPALVRQVRDDIGWSVTRGSGGAHRVTIRAEDLLGPAAQELAVSLLERAVVAAATAPPPAAPAPRRTTSRGSAGTAGAAAPRARKAAAPAKPAAPEPPAAPVCPTCFQEMLGGLCANCD